MKNINKSIIISSMMLLMAFAVNTVNAEGEKIKEEKAPVELKHQTNCPVMGGVIDSSSYTDIQGQRVYHCCPMCTKALTENPDKYFKKAAEEGILFENIQTTCPVSGEELKDKTSFLDFEGRRIYFCCDDCHEKFMADPQGYLKSMDNTSDEKGTKDKMDMKEKSGTDHSSHNH
ncbi:MAG: hypothetical protein ABIJ12_11765 [bacterium]